MVTCHSDHNVQSFSPCLSSVLVFTFTSFFEDLTKISRLLLYVSWIYFIEIGDLYFIEAVQPVGDKVSATLAEFYEAQGRWGKEITPDHREKMIEEASRVANTRVGKRIQHKLNLAQTKFQRVEKLLSQIEASMISNAPDYDQEVISEEERAMFRKVGLKMKAYLPLVIRGVFDGVME